MAPFYPLYGNSNLDIYIVSMYWTITTITTVGYGDISGNNLPEKIYCCIIMIVGVFAFGFANGTLAAIMTNYDNKSEDYQNKMEILDNARRDYELTPTLYTSIKKTLDFNDENSFEDLNKFI